MNRKNLLLAWFLNVIPGLGLIYVDRTGLGILFIVAFGVGMLFTFSFIGSLIGVPMIILSGVLACILSVVYGSKYNKQFLGR